MLIHEDLLNPKRTPTVREIQTVRISVRAKTYSDGELSGGVEIKGLVQRGAHTKKTDSHLPPSWTKEQLRKGIEYVYRICSRDIPRLEKCVELQKVAGIASKDASEKDWDGFMVFIEREQKKTGYTTDYYEMTLEIAQAWIDAIKEEY